MKYGDFYAYLCSKVNNLADIGPSISIKIVSGQGRVCPGEGYPSPSSVREPRGRTGWSKAPSRCAVWHNAPGIVPKARSRSPSVERTFGPRRPLDEDARCASEDPSMRTRDARPKTRLDGSLTPQIAISDKKIRNTHRFLIFPVKIYGENMQHLNILLLDRKNKFVERYEPFNQYIYFNQINDLLESLLYKLMEAQKIYFFKYQSTLNEEKILNDKNCGIYCVQYILRRILFARKAVV